MHKALFSDRKATHAAAYLLHLGGGSMSLLKLMKLIYMAEKLSYARYGDPLTGDGPFALKDGPILSGVYDRAKGNVPEGSVWSELILPRRGNQISLVNQGLDPESLGGLCDADVAVLDAIWRKFGRMTAWELRNHTHGFPEWENPLEKNQKQLRIRIDRLLMSVGYQPDEAAERQRELECEGRLREAFCPQE